MGNSGGYIGGYGSNFRIVCAFDPPQVLSCSVTNIPGSGSLPLQVVASLPDNINAYEVIDAVGKFIGLYAGAPGLEVLQFIIGGGANYGSLRHAIAKGTRISIRHMDVQTITKGSLVVHFCRK